MIAVWLYIDVDRVTQSIDGQQVPNLLESGASFHIMHIPKRGSTDTLSSGHPSFSFDPEVSTHAAVDIWQPS